MTEFKYFYMKIGLKINNNNDKINIFNRFNINNRVNTINTYQFKIGKCERLKFKNNDDLRKYAIRSIWRAPDISGKGIYIYNMYHPSINCFKIFVSTDSDILSVIRENNNNSVLTYVLVKLYTQFKKKGLINS